MTTVLRFLERSDWKHPPATQDEPSNAAPPHFQPPSDPPQPKPPDSVTRDELRRRLLEMIRRNEASRHAKAR